MITRTITVASFVLLSSLVFGCSGDDVERFLVTGSVTFDGEPVSTGNISFVPLDCPTGGTAEIENGKYSFAGEVGLAKGNYSVEITSMQKTGNQVKQYNEMVDEIVNVIPMKYNAKTTLKANVSGGRGKFDFDLQTD